MSCWFLSHLAQIQKSSYGFDQDFIKRLRYYIFTIFHRTMVVLVVVWWGSNLFIKLATFQLWLDLATSYRDDHVPPLVFLSSGQQNPDAQTEFWNFIFIVFWSCTALKSSAPVIWLTGQPNEPRPAKWRETLTVLLTRTSWRPLDWCRRSRRVGKAGNNGTLNQ